MWEVNLLYENMQFSNVDMWETTRLLGYMVSAPYMKEKKSITDFLPLPWDRTVEQKEEHNYNITDEEISKLKEESKIFEGMMKAAE